MWPELIRWTMAMLGKGLDGVQAGPYGGLRVIATLEFLSIVMRKRLGYKETVLLWLWSFAWWLDSQFLDFSRDKNVVY